MCNNCGITVEDICDIYMCKIQSFWYIKTPILCITYYPIYKISILCIVKFQHLIVKFFFEKVSIITFTIPVEYHVMLIIPKNILKVATFFLCLYIWNRYSFFLLLTSLSFANSFLNVGWVLLLREINSGLIPSFPSFCDCEFFSKFKTYKLN